MAKPIVAFKQPELLIPKREVRPSTGQLPFRCGRCGTPSFGVHVRPGLDGGARVEDLVCTYCLAVYRLNDRHRVAGTEEEPDGSDD